MEQLIEIIVVITFGFIFGASIGSFLSVVISRTETDKKGIINGSSECPNCLNKLTALDLIPIVSYLACKGKCSKCGLPNPKFYLKIELFFGYILSLVFINIYFLIINLGNWISLGISILALLSSLVLCVIFYGRFKNYYKENVNK